MTDAPIAVSPAATSPTADPAAPHTPAAAAPATPGAGDFAALKAALPAELRDSPALRSYASLEGMARSLVEAQRLVGKRIADATPDELARIDARYGRPDSPERYELPGADPAAPDEFAAAVRRWFFDAGLSQRQATALAERWGDFAAARQADARHAAEQGRAEAERALRAEWGGAFDARLRAAARAAREFGGDELTALLEETRLGDDPRVIRAFARIAARIGEEPLAGAASRDFAPTPEAARVEIARLMGQPAYFDAAHPEHERAVTRMTALFAAAYPEREPPPDEPEEP